MSQEEKEMRSTSQLRALSFVALGSFLFFFYVAYMGFSGMIIFDGDGVANRGTEGAQVQGVTDGNEGDRSVTVNSRKESVNVLVNNANLNKSEATLELKSNGTVNLAGVELYFDIPATLTIVSIECTAVMTCISAEIVGDKIEIIALVPPDAKNVTTASTLEIAKIFYVGGTGGELSLDSRSVVLEVGSDQSVLSGSNPYLSVGRL